MTDNPDSGHPPAAGASTEPTVPAAVPTMQVFHEVASLADSVRGSERHGRGDQEDAVTDEERTRYGVLLDRAAERGLLDPAEYGMRLRELAEATTTARMLEIVTELPAFTVPRSTTTPAGRRRRATADVGSGRQRRGMTMWVVLAVVIAVVAASLVVLALSVEHLSHSRDTVPTAAGLLSAPRP